MATGSHQVTTYKAVTINGPHIFHTITNNISTLTLQDTKLLISDSTTATSLNDGALHVNGGTSINGALYTSIINIAENVNLEWNTTDLSLDFVFSSTAVPLSYAAGVSF